MKQHIRYAKHQRGMTMYGVMFLLIVIGFAATAAVKLGPSYMDNNTVRSALNDIKASYEGADMQEVSNSEIKGKLSKYFQVNMVADEIEKSVKITRDKQKVILSANYEIRSNFMGNVDIVLVFNNEVDLAE